MKNVVLEAIFRFCGRMQIKNFELTSRAIFRKKNKKSDNMKRFSKDQEVFFRNIFWKRILFEEGSSSLKAFKEI